MSSFWSKVSSSSIYESSSSSSKTKSSTVQLVIENKEMEDRLKSLKKIMAMEKTQRSNENMQGKNYWKSSQSGGPLHASASVQNGSSKKRKVKVLTGNEKYYTKEKLSCGQCDQYKASIACVECIENYCTVCFTKFHQKGALSNHRVRPLDVTVSQVTAADCSPVTKTCSTGTGTDYSSTSDHIVCGSPHTTHDSSLLDGTYDEEASSKSFQDAILAWRNSKNTTKKSDCTATTSCGIQTMVSDTSKPTLHIHFTPSPSSRLSYMERLLLQKKRSNPSFLKSQSNLNKVKGHEPLDESTNYDLQCDVEIGVPSEHNLFYSSNDSTATIDQSHDQNNHSSPGRPSSVVIQDVRECLVVDLPATDNGVSSTGTSCDSVQVHVPSKKEKHRQQSATKMRRKEPKGKKKPSKKSHTQPTSPKGSSISPLTLPCQPAPYKGLTGFFLVDSAAEPSTNNDTTKQPNEQSTTSELILSLQQTQWIPMSSIIPSTDNTLIASHDIPPHCISSNNSHHDTTTTEDTDSGDDTVIDDNTMSDYDDEDTAVLEDLGRELIMMSRTELHDDESTDDEVDTRALSRMTIEELVEEFEEDLSQVMSNED